MITRDQLIQIIPDVSKSKFGVDDICDALNDSSLNTKFRMAAFIGQIGAESAFSHVVENLNYSADGLQKVFKKYFDAETAQEYARQPEKIANRVYANRMGNADENSGDGWKYRGRGFIQLTGRFNYMVCGTALGIDLISSPEYLETLDGAMKSALWFWDSNDLNTYADHGDILTITKKINGGTNGLQTRQELFNKALHIL